MVAFGIGVPRGVQQKSAHPKAIRLLRLLANERRLSSAVQLRTNLHGLRCFRGLSEFDDHDYLLHFTELMKRQPAGGGANLCPHEIVVNRSEGSEFSSSPSARHLGRWRRPMQGARKGEVTKRILTDSLGTRAPASST